jgi:hypothetical protein
VDNPLAVPQQHFHFLLHSRMGVMVSLKIQFFDVFFAKTQSNHAEYSFLNSSFSPFYLTTKNSPCGLA